MAEERIVKIFIDDGSLERTLTKDKKLLDGIVNKQKDLKEGTKEWSRLEEQRLKILQRVDQAQQQMAGKLGVSMTQLKQKQRDLNKELAQMPIELRKSSQAARDLAFVEAAIARVNSESRQVVGVFGSIRERIRNMAAGFNQYFGFLGVGIGSITGITMAIQKQIDRLSILDDAYADVMKTTQLSREEVEELNTELNNIDTRTPELALLGLAEDAGKLGKESVEDVKKFVAEANMIKVALGKDLGEDALIQIGKLSKIFGEEMTNIASGINSVGAASEASESYQVNFASRMSGVAKTARVTAGDIFGYGATLEGLGQSAEVGSTALNDFFLEFVKDAEKFGEQAGFANGELQSLMDQKGTNAAFVEFLKKLKDGSAGSQDLLVKLEKLGITSSRGANVFLALAENTDALAKQQKIANDAIKEGTSVVDEYNIKNNNMAARIEKKSKEIKGYINNLFSDDMLVSVWDFFAGLPAALRNNEVAIFSLGGAYLALNGLKIEALLIGAKERIMAGQGILLKIKDAAATRLLALQQAYLNGVQAAGVAGSGKFIASLKGIKAALMATLGPVGLIIMGITGIVSAIKFYDKNNAESIRLEKEKFQAQIDLFRVNEQLKSSYNKLHEAVSSMNQMTVEEQKLLRENIRLKLQEAEAQLLLAQQKQKDIQAENTRTSVWGQTVNMFSNLGNAAGWAVDNANDAMENGKEAAGELNDEIEAIHGTMEKLKEDFQDVNNIMEAESLADAMPEESVANLEAKVQKYALALRNAKIGSEDYIRVQQKLRATEAKLNDTRPKPGPDKQDLERAKKGYQSLIEENEKFFQDLHTEHLEGMAKELETERLKYQEKIDAIRKFLKEQGKYLSGPEKKKLLDAEKQLELEQVKALAEIKERHEKELFKKISDLRVMLQTATLSEQQQEIQAVQHKYAELAKEAEGNAEALKQIKELQELELAGITKKYADQELEIRKKLNEKKLTEDQKAILAIDDEYKALIEQANGNEELIAEIKKQWVDDVENYRAQKTKETQDMINAFVLEQTKLLSDTVFTILDNKRQQDLDAETRKQDSSKEKALRDLDEKKQQELSKKNLTETQKADIDKRFEAERLVIEEQADKKMKELKLKDWEANRRASITQAIINGALSVTNILATRPKVDFGIGDAIMIGAALATTASQIAVISSQKAPEFAKGARLSGPSHAMGGMPIVDPGSGRKVAEVEGGETILSKRTSDNNRHLVDSLLYASMFRNGDRIDYPSFTPQPRFDYAGAIKSVKITRFASGGVFNEPVSTAAPTSGATNTTAPISTARMEMLLEANLQFMMKLSDRLDIPLQAVVNYDNQDADRLSELLQENQEIRSAGYVG